MMNVYRLFQVVFTNGSDRLVFFWWQFFVCFHRERLHNFCESASKKPLISLVGGIVRDYQPLWESVYFYSKPLFF